MTPMSPSSVGNIQRHKTRGRVAANATGGRDRVGLRHPDGRDPEGQRAAGSSRGLRRARYALGNPRRPNLQGLRQAKRGGADEPALTGVAALIWPAIRLAEEIGQRKLSGSFTSQNRNAVTRRMTAGPPECSP